MTRNNSCNFMVDIGNDKEFKRTNINGVSTAYVRFYGFVKGTIGANSVEGVRIIAYGPLAELIYAHIQPGSRVYVMTHLQIRRDKKEISLMNLSWKKLNT